MPHTHWRERPLVRSLGDFPADLYPVRLLRGSNHRQQYHQFQLPQVLASSHIFYNSEVMRIWQALKATLFSQTRYTSTEHL